MMFICVIYNVYIAQLVDQFNVFLQFFFIQKGGERGTQKSGLHKKRFRVDDGKDAEAGAGSKTGVVESSS